MSNVILGAGIFTLLIHQIVFKKMWEGAMQAHIFFASICRGTS